MNERMNELARQSGISFLSNVPPDMLDKFAELIVKECAEVAHCNFHVDGVTLGNIMKEHFGVEE